MITVLFVKLPKHIQDSLDDTILFHMEESLQESFPHTVYDMTDEGIFVFRETLHQKNPVTFADYMQEGIFFKNFLLQNHIATEENYKEFFALRTQNSPETKKAPSPSDLDAFIAPVDRNDPKLQAVLKRLEGLRERKTL